MALEDFGLVALVLMLAVGTVIRQYAPRFTNLPYTVIMMIIGGLAGVIIQAQDHHETARSIRDWYNISPEVLFWAVIPVLVFESAFNMDTHIFIKLKWQILTLAGPGVVVAAVLTAAFCRYAFVEYDWDWPTSLMFGAITAATDPVAVVALLHELGVSERLGILIEGESLLNDGTAIVVFEVFYDALEENSCNPKMPEPGTVFVALLRLGFVGPILGGLCGWVASAWLGSMLNDTFSEITITIMACYGSYAMGDGVVGTSGVLTVVFCGMYLSRYGKGRISAKSEHAVKMFWGVFGHVANTVIFFITGLIMAVKVFGSKKHDLGKDCVRCSKDVEEAEEFFGEGGGEGEGSSLEEAINEAARRFLEAPEEAETPVDCHTFRNIDFWYLIALYLALHVVRAIVVLVSAPVLYKGAYGMTWQQLSIITYGGLRGAVGLTLALVINDTDGFESRLQNRVLFQIAGIAFLTLIINGTTARYVMHYLGLDRKSDAENEIFAHVTANVDRKLASEMIALRGDPYLGDADWHFVWRYLPVLTGDSYWYRLRDNFIQLSAAEHDDLAELSVRKRELREEEQQIDDDNEGSGLNRCLALIVRDAQDWLFESTASNKDSYPLPPLLKDVWYGYHKTFGNTAPLFIHMSEHRVVAPPSAADDDDDDGKGGLVQFYDKGKGGNNRLDRVADYSHAEIFRAVRGSALMQDQEHTQHHALGMSMASPDDDDDDLGNAVGAAPTRDNVGALHPAEIQPGHMNGGGGRDDPTAAGPTPRESKHVEVTASGLRLRAHYEADDLKLSHEEEGLLEEARSRCLWAVKANLQVAFAAGRISSAALRLLIENIDEMEDDAGSKLDGWEKLKLDRRTSTVLGLQDNKALVPAGLGIRNLIDGMVFRKTAFVFEVAYTYATALDNIEVEEITDDARLRKKLAAEIQNQQMAAKIVIADFQQTFPDVAWAVKTRVATGLMLVRQSELYEELAEHGHITEKECEEAGDAIDEMRQRLMSHPFAESPPSLEGRLGDIAFLAPLSPAERDALVNDPTICHAEVVFANTCLARQGRSSLEPRGDHQNRAGWFVVIRGSVLVSQSSVRGLLASTTTSNGAATGGKDYDEGPHVPPTASSDDVVLGPGSVCCLEEQLLGMPFAATYKTVSMVSVAFFDLEAMTSLASRNAAVRFSLWWSVALSALRGYEDFSKLPASELESLCRNTRFVEAPEEQRLQEIKSTSSFSRKKSLRRKSSKTSLLEKSPSTSNLQRPARTGVVTSQRPQQQGSYAAAAVAKDDELNLASSGGGFVETILSCAGGPYDPQSNTQSTITSEHHQQQQQPRSGRSTPTNPIYVTVADETKEQLTNSKLRFGEVQGYKPGAKLVGDGVDDEDDVDEDFKDNDLTFELQLPPNHSLLVLRGAAKTSDGRPGGPQGVRTEVARAISIVTIHPTSTSRVVKLGFGAKAFILNDDLLNTQGIDIHGDHAVILDDPALKDIHHTAQARKTLVAAGLLKDAAVAWVADDKHPAPRRRSLQKN